MKLSVVILNYNVRYFLELCLKSVQEAISQIDAEIIVIDNNSTDDSCAMVKKLFPNVSLIENKNNFGFSKGNNIAVAQAKGEYVCILNPDIVVAEDTFIKLLEFADSKQNLGIIGCRLIDGNGRYLPESKRNIPIVKVAFQKMLGYSKNYYANHLTEFESGKIKVLVGAIMLMKRNVYNQVNGFDEDYFMYGEDVDLSFKVVKEGFDNYYFGDTTIIHFKGESTLKNEVYAKRFYGAMQIFYKKHFRSNLLFDTVVWLGIKFVKLFRSSESTLENTVNQYILLSNKNYPELEAKLSKTINTISDLSQIQIQMQSEIIFDANSMSYKEIVESISKLKNNAKHTYKILPKNSNFIVGSNDSKQRGQVITF